MDSTDPPRISITPSPPRTAVASEDGELELRHTQSDGEPGTIAKGSGREVAPHGIILVPPCTAGVSVSIDEVQLTPNSAHDLCNEEASNPGSLTVEPSLAGGDDGTHHDSVDLEADLQDRSQIKNVHCPLQNKAERLAPAAAAMIRGSDPRDIVALIPAKPQQSASGITDLGDQMFRRRTDSASTDSATSSVASAPTSLRNKLLNAVETPYSNNTPTTGFVPRAVLHRLVKTDVVEAELLKAEPSIRRLLKTLTFRSSTKEQLQKQIETRAKQICGSTPGGQVQPGHRRVGSHANFSEIQGPPQEKTFRKIFAIILLMGQKKDKIQAFIDDNVSDADLPLAVAETLPNGKRCKRLELRRRKDLNTRLTCFKGWKTADIDRFETWQWAVISPYFGRDEVVTKKIPHYILPRKAILPFQKWEVVDSRGGASEVYKAKIHPEHHGFKERAERDRSSGESGHKNLQADLFAVKCLHAKTTTGKQFKKEVGILEIINKNPHDHLIHLLVTYEQHGRYNLVFPLAKYNLIEYWKLGQQDIPHSDQMTTLWLAEQCQGLASGLQQIHRILRTSSSSFQSASSLVRQSLFPVPETQSPEDQPPLKMLCCRHGDIKPQNILLFADPNERSVGGNGILKIADFGAAEFGEIEAVPQKRLPFTPIYHPPEASDAIIRSRKTVMSTSYDIWGLGCLFLEFATWCFGGWKHVEEFLTARMEPELPIQSGSPVQSSFRTATFFRLSKSTDGQVVAELKDSVNTFVDSLRKRPECTEFFHDFLDMIQKEMLVIDYKDRRTATEIEQELDRLRGKGRADGAYFVPAQVG